MVRIKICGIRDVETAMAAVEAGADAIGLVFVPRSPRMVTQEQAQAILEELPPFVEPVALFVDSPVERMYSMATHLGIRTVQLHGGETMGEAGHLAPLRVLKAFPFDAGIGGQFRTWKRGCRSLTGVIVDAPRSGAGELPGGTGRAVDWDALAGMDRGGWPPLVLAGGLTPGNVAEAVARVRPFAVDVSSGVESAPGVKDPARIRDFCQAARVS